LIFSELDKALVQAMVSPFADRSTFSVLRRAPERILWLVDEYVMKSEMPERLVWVIERATHPYHAADFRVDHSADSEPSAHQRRAGYGFGDW
jgi:hypothetical protein